MKKKFEQIAEKYGFKVQSDYHRLDSHEVMYCVFIFKDNHLIERWNCGYFIGEVDTANSKDIILPKFEELLKSLSPATATKQEK